MRKEGLDIALKELMAELFGSSILSFNQQAALAYAPLISRARNNGWPISVADGQIAAIAIVHGFPIAARDVAPFIAAGRSACYQPLGTRSTIVFGSNIILLVNIDYVEFYDALRTFVGIYPTTSNAGQGYFLKSGNQNPARHIVFPAFFELPAVPSCKKSIAIL